MTLTRRSPPETPQCPRCDAHISKTLLGFQPGRRCPYCGAEVDA